MKPNYNIPLILASTSPRRIELLKTISLPVFLEIPLTEEVHQHGESPRQMVERLAQEKASSVILAVKKKHPHVLILAADTIVVAPDKKQILGKPKSTQDAFQMLKKLSGRTHTVLTAYCILQIQKRVLKKSLLRTVSSQVKMRPLTHQMIENYIRTEEPADKAGAYAAQGIGMALIEGIHGSYTNVVGLPITQLVMDLEKHFHISPLFRDEK